MKTACTLCCCQKSATAEKSNVPVCQRQTVPWPKGTEVQLSAHPRSTANYVCVPLIDASFAHKYIRLFNVRQYIKDTCNGKRYLNHNKIQLIFTYSVENRRFIFSSGNEINGIYLCWHVCNATLDTKQTYAPANIPSILFFRKTEAFSI